MWRGAEGVDGIIIRGITMSGHFDKHGWWVVNFTDEELKEVKPETSLEKTRGMWLFKGYLLGKNGRYEDALKFSEEVLKINPMSENAWCLKGASLGSLGRHEEAIMCFDKALKIDPNYEDAWCDKGITLREMGRYEDAIECLVEALNVNPEDEDVISLRKDFLDNLSK